MREQNWYTVQASRYGCVTENDFSYSSTKTYVVGTQKNRLDETVLLSTQNTCLNWWIRKYSQFYANYFCWLTGLRYLRQGSSLQIWFSDLGPSQSRPPFAGGGLSHNLSLDWSPPVDEGICRGSYMSAHVLLNLLNELGKRGKMQGLPSILSLLGNEFNKFNNTKPRML